MPIHNTKEMNDMSVVRDCLVCGYGGTTNEINKSYQEISVCPKCNGAYVDVYHIHKYKDKDWKPNKDTQKEALNILDGFDTLKRAFEQIKKKQDAEPLLTIELQDMNSVPVVKYKGEKLKM